MPEQQLHGRTGLAAPVGASRRARAWLGRRSALWWILAAGIVLRVCVMAWYTPSNFNFYGGDSTRYMRLPISGVTDLFGDPAMPAGYPAFLAALRGMWDWLPFTTVVQHALGVGAAALLYFGVVRIGVPRWAALLPAAVVALSGDQIFLEHGIYTEALWTPVLALAMYALCRALAARADAVRWLALGGAALGAATLVRHVAEFLPLVLAVWAAFAFGGGLGVRARHAAAVLLPALVVIGAYMVVAKPIAGGYSGLVENSGFSLYGRVAQFADCSRFTPPAGTRVLCVTTPPDQRPGPFYWTFGADSPLNARRHSSLFDAHEQTLLRSFARQAILHQPWDYAHTVAKDVVRYLAPDVGTPRPDDGSDTRAMSFASTTPAAQGASLAQLAQQFSTTYDGVGSGEASQAARTALGAYQEVFRVQGLLTLALLALALAGALFGRGPLRAGAALFLLAAVTLAVVPPLFSSYDVRYAVPPIDLLAAGSACGLAVWAERRAAGRRGV